MSKKKGKTGSLPRKPRGPEAWQVSVIAFWLSILVWHLGWLAQIGVHGWFWTFIAWDLTWDIAWWILWRIMADEIRAVRLERDQYDRRAQLDIDGLVNEALWGGRRSWGLQKGS